jgi:hypothetical protein
MPHHGKRPRLESPLDSDRRRVVQGACTPAEHALLLEAHSERGAISELVRDAIARAARVDVEPLAREGTTRFVGARLDPEEIAQLSLAAAATGLEPTVLLRLLVLARARLGSGDALWRLLSAVRK